MKFLGILQAVLMDCKSMIPFVFVGKCKLQEILVFLRPADDADRDPFQSFFDSLLDKTVKVSTICLKVCPSLLFSHVFDEIPSVSIEFFPCTPEKDCRFFLPRRLDPVLQVDWGAVLRLIHVTSSWLPSGLRLKSLKRPDDTVLRVLSSIYYIFILITKSKDLCTKGGIPRLGSF